jgi:cyclase
MMRARIIPCLLLRDRQLVKGERFGKYRYIGDPINAVRIFNERDIDELMLIDIGATPQRREPDFAHIEEIVSECFVPICYGGGVSSVEHARRLIRLGVEKIALNSAVLSDLPLVRAIADEVGSQAVVVVMDVRRPFMRGRRVWSFARKPVSIADPVEYAKEAERAGCGEIVVSAVDRDGMMSGYDIDLVRSVADAVRVPVIALGGGGSLADVRAVVHDGRASAAAAGSMFVFQGRHRAVLINFPTAAAIDDALKEEEAGS